MSRKVLIQYLVVGDEGEGEGCRENSPSQENINEDEMWRENIYVLGVISESESESERERKRERERERERKGVRGQAAGRFQWSKYVSNTCNKLISNIHLQENTKRVKRMKICIEPICTLYSYYL